MKADFCRIMLRIVTNKVIRKPKTIVSTIVFMSVLLYLQYSLSLKAKLRGEYTIFQDARLALLDNDSTFHNFSTLPAHLTELSLFDDENITSTLKIGHVNVHLWKKICSITLDSLKEYPLFPHWPDVRGCPKMPDNLVSIMHGSWNAQRVMGLLHPPISGLYQFEIASNFMSEFWLSPSRVPSHAILMARINKNTLHGLAYSKGVHIPSSKAVHLKSGKQYYFEVLNVINNFNYEQVQIKWKIPGSTVFSNILNEYISTVLINDTSLDARTRTVVQMSPSIHSDETLKRPNQQTWQNDITTTFGRFFNTSFTMQKLDDLMFLKQEILATAFNQCTYSPSYTKNLDFKPYRGVYFTHFSDVFPADDTGGKVWKGYVEKEDHRGNTLIEEPVVIDVVKKFMSSLEDTYPKQFSLANIVRVERNVDAKLGNRFFLEMVLQNNNTHLYHRVSGYFFLPQNSSVLCIPEGMIWKPRVLINVIINTKNQGPWVEHYIRNIGRVIRETHDEMIRIIIVDYGNNGLEPEKEFKRNGITNFEVIKQNGKFHKTFAIELAVDSIKDPNSIVFLTDLHLHMPNDIFDSVRKHTIQGKMCYTPVVFRLKHCSRPETEQTSVTGFWDSYAFGVFSTYKTDWNYFGGLNVTAFQNKWGGEDWEMVDRILKKELEIERLRLPHFYHFFHDKNNMWDNAV
ncbi:N-acetyl-beta-glucosaminyl-glycoprotein 4-beta-N-acetylgalactosaminyltransferase 1-like isoform X2 [Actinia tenebrosa]|uniref:Hexosyltransferase n=1 Tax=Actinia tenebrosa TaxID=6105 RepID=A0A6P8HJK4_ACTTE|nr:N-acetyl-beta-glucosaminyl-glycoprotein 4-beta-N-acetylgalactosaminyltransferase 1-like isoform X2 [Actinia tenebrosa]